MSRKAKVLPLLATAMAVLIFVSGCRKEPPATPLPEPPPPTAPAPPPAPPPPPAPAPAPTPPPLTEDEIFARKSLDQINAERPLDDIYFALDSSEVSEAGRSLLQKNSEWLKRWSSTRITIEGHCDARGSSEYNLALGERRGAAVKSYLTSLGISGDRVAVVSKGEESPSCTAEAESCWSQNRRGHFVVTAK